MRNKAIEREREEKNEARRAVSCTTELAGSINMNDGLLQERRKEAEMSYTRSSARSGSEEEQVGTGSGAVAGCGAQGVEADTRMCPIDLRRPTL